MGLLVVTLGTVALYRCGVFKLATDEKVSISPDASVDRHHFLGRLLSSTNKNCADFSQWPAVDNGVTCGGCTALVETAPYGGRCDAYCRSFGHVFVAAAEEEEETCKVKASASCSEEIKDTSDMLCTCQASTCDAKCDFKGESYTCRERVDWLRKSGSLSDALQTVNSECDTQCSCSVGDFGSAPSPDAGNSLMVMSYNTEYRGYNSRVWAYGKKIREVGAATVGTQECQDRDALASASGYSYVSGTRPNPIFFNPAKVSLVEGTGGELRIPRDNYARRTITFAKFKLGSTEFWHFNTHLPHNHNEASSRNTHARIAQMLLQKRRELGAEDMPSIVTGDMNPFASNGARKGSLESNLVAGGFRKAYQARGNPGYRGLDKISVSRHWTFANGADRGTGSSDHPAIAVDLTLV